MTIFKCITFPTFTNIVMDGIVIFTMMYKIKNSADRTSRVKGQKKATVSWRTPNRVNIK